MTYALVKLFSRVPSPNILRPWSRLQSIARIKKKWKEKNSEGKVRKRYYENAQSVIFHTRVAITRRMCSLSNLANLLI